MIQEIFPNKKKVFFQRDKCLKTIQRWEDRYFESGHIYTIDPKTCLFRLQTFLIESLQYFYIFAPYFGWQSHAARFYSLTLFGGFFSVHFLMCSAATVVDFVTSFSTGRGLYDVTHIFNHFLNRFRSFVIISYTLNNYLKHIICRQFSLFNNQFF